ncbi:hypothetical protein IJU97_00310 [bacterium]|nr:hypothetical protein [bacterium]
MQYHKDYQYLINYFLIDYTIYIAYRNFLDCRREIDGIDIKNDRLYDLATFFNMSYNKDTFNNLMKIPFSKLSWKLKFIRSNSEGHLTMYNKFLEENKID